MAVNASGLLMGDILYTPKSGKCLVSQGEATFTVDFVVKGVDGVWEAVGPGIMENIHEGVNTTIILTGDVGRGTFGDLLARLNESIAPTDAMRLVEVSTTATFSCCDILNEKFRDVLGKEATFQERRIRSGKADGLQEVALNSETVSGVQSHNWNIDSTLMANISLKWSNGIISRFSQIQMVEIPMVRSSAEKVKSPHLALLQVMDALSRKKKGFVPYRLSAPTQLMSEVLESSKLFVVGGVGSAMEASDTTIKLVSKCRDIITQLRSTEEYVGDHEMKNILFSLRRKLAEIRLSPEPLPKIEHIAPLEITATLQLNRQHKERACALAERRLIETKRSLKAFTERLEQLESARLNATRSDEQHVFLGEEAIRISDDLNEERQNNYAVMEELEDARLLEDELNARRRLQEERGDEATADRAMLQSRALAGTFRAAHKLGVERALAKSNADRIERLRDDIAGINSAMQILEEDIAIARRWHEDVEGLAENAKKAEHIMARRLASIRTDVDSTIAELDGHTRLVQGELECMEVIDCVLEYKEASRRKLADEESRFEKLGVDVHGVTVSSLTAGKNMKSFESNYTIDALTAHVQWEETLKKQQGLDIHSLERDVSDLTAEWKRLDAFKNQCLLNDARSLYEAMSVEYDVLAGNYATLQQFVCKKEQNA